jgi:hypothetical protein
VATTNPTRIQKAIEGAIGRLVQGSPNDPELASKAALGKLRINISTVAQEAGVSRTLIGTENCQYPELRAKVLGLSGKDVAVERKASELDALKDEIRRLKHEVKLRDTSQAALMIRCEQLTLQVLELGGTVENVVRIRKRQTRG